MKAALFLYTFLGKEEIRLNVSKAYEITDAKIQFVSLVDKAANLKKFLITKAEAGKATFSTYGRIVKADADSHFVTGIVYEPMTEDAHGNYMTEAEITKAAYGFAKSGNKVDLQHSYEPIDGATVVESWIAKSDFKCGSETVQKGTWLMTMEIADQQIWEAIEKGEITGFSMGGVGVYSEEDVKLENVEKTVAGAGKEPEQTEKKGVFKKLAAMLGFDVVEKGEFADKFAKEKKSKEFWAAFYSLEQMLCHWDSWNDTDVFETNEAKIKEALTEFSTIITDILTSEEPITKQLAAAEKPVEMSGKKMSGANKETLQTAYDALGALLEAVADPAPDEDEDSKKDTEPKSDKDEDKEEEKELTKAEVEKMIQDSVTAAVSKAMEGQQPAQEQLTEAVTKEMVQGMIESAVAKAVEPILKARGVPAAMNDGANTEQPVEKHYLHGIL